MVAVRKQKKINTVQTISPKGGPQPGPQKLFTRVRKAVLLMGEELLIPQSMSHCLAPFIVRNTNVMMLESVRLL